MQARLPPRDCVLQPSQMAPTPPSERVFISGIRTCTEPRCVNALAWPREDPSVIHEIYAWQENSLRCLRPSANSYRSGGSREWRKRGSHVLSARIIPWGERGGSPPRSATILYAFFVWLWPTYVASSIVEPRPRTRECLTVRGGPQAISHVA